MKDFLKISPIGGVKQIGSNCTLVETNDFKLLIDCGILFPNESVFEINYLIPDLKNLTDIDAIIITHGHEDHIGAVSHFVEALPQATIYAPRFAKELIKYKLEQRNIVKKIEDLSTHTFGSIDLKAFHVNHSIPDTKGLVISHKKLDTSLTFISDFKIDKKTSYEPPFNFEALEDQKIFKNRIALLDSTNILSKNLSTPSEMDLIESLETLIKSCDGNAFITTFSSNIHRIQTLINIAKRLNRVVIPYGRSMQRYIEVAGNNDFLDTHDLIKDADDKSIKKKKIVILSGCQGEFRGALKRVVSKQDSRFKLKPEDVVIFSSKSIPGNEKEISQIYNEITEQGTTLHTPDRHSIHASGHPGKNDLKEVYLSLNPTHAYPIHGESFFLREHVDFITENKFASNTQMITNGDEIIVTAEAIKINNVANHPDPLLIHGKDLLIERDKISERRKIATQGVIFISFSKESINKHKPIFDITTNGLPTLVDTMIPEFSKVISNEFQAVKNKPLDEKKEKIRVLTRRFFGNRLGYRPIAIVHIT